MSEYIDTLIEALTEKKDFESLDGVITEETNERLKEYQTRLSQTAYEEMRDTVFSISAITRKEAFRIGFKTAVRLILECRSDTHSL